MFYGKYAAYTSVVFLIYFRIGRKRRFDHSMIGLQKDFTVSAPMLSSNFNPFQFCNAYDWLLVIKTLMF